MAFWPLRRVFRLFWWILCTLTFMALPLMIWDFRRKGYNIKLQSWFIGGIFVILSIPISVYEVAMHTEYYSRPRLQRHVIRILWMVPIYGVDAWLALRFRDAREYLDPIRECYEAFVIWSFYAYLMAYLEDELGNVEAYLARKPPVPHVFPFNLILRPWPMGQRFLMETKKGVMSYVIIRPLTTGIGLFSDMYGKYGQGRVDLHKSYIYLAVTASFSQLWSIYCLAQLYRATHKELAPIRPLSKFLCIKAVVFLTFWQGVALALLVSGGIITDESWSPYDQLSVATGIQDFLVCIEMFVAALAHAYAFPPKDYMGGTPTKGFLYNVRHMFDLRDVVHDMGEVVESHVDTAVDTAMQTTHAVLTVPKKAVRTAAKGLKAAAQAPESLLNYLTSDGYKRPSRTRTNGSSHAGESEEDEAAGLLDKRGSMHSVATHASLDGIAMPNPHDVLAGSEHFTSMEEGHSMYGKTRSVVDRPQKPRRGTPSRTRRFSHDGVSNSRQNPSGPMQGEVEGVSSSNNLQSQNTQSFSLQSSNNHRVVSLVRTGSQPQGHLGSALINEVMLQEKDTRMPKTKAKSSRDVRQPLLGDDAYHPRDPLEDSH